MSTTVLGASFTSSDAIASYSIVGAVLIATWLLSRWGHRAVDRMAGRRDVDTERRQRIDTLWTVSRRVMLIVLWLVGALMLLTVWDVSIAPFLAVGTVVGVALGFGAQSLVKDLIAGFFILVENQFAIGDVVTISGTTGAVEDIQLRVTVLRDLDGRAHYVPNGTIEVATNYTQVFAQVVVDVGISYDSDVDTALGVVHDEALRMYREEAWSSKILQEPEILGVNELGDSSVVLRLVLRTDPDARWPAKREFLRRVKNRLDAEGIEIPFPHRTIVMKEPG